ncbi:hypothetical protein GCM10010435_24590 [Winogradskya consettensis]|uniref:MoaD/ThiS family protein n=1 Tax=Winogradskya consettensis TaxID=113560 RepID=A0A919T0K4_9ACTN|nr:MoaD/ThiS family protein [Actinoplanes consettensis]GIM82497.1 hypothetical protein Aco04nite_81910 [Actinoplanes consettensis]
MIKIVLPSVWTGTGTTVFAGEEGPLYEVIKRFAAGNPQFGRRLIGPDGQPLTYLNLCVDDEMIPRHLRAHTEVEAGCTVTVISPMAGG